MITLMSKFVSFLVIYYVVRFICCTATGVKGGRSLLIEDGALPWIVQNANNEVAPIRRHIELALCHLAQHGKLTLPFFL